MCIFFILSPLSECSGFKHGVWCVNYLVNFFLIALGGTCFSGMLEAGFSVELHLFSVV